MRYWETDRFGGDNQIKELVECYEQSRDEGSAVYLDADELTDIAEYYLCHNKPSQAQQAIALAVALHPDAVAPKTYLVRDCLCRGQWEEAERLLGQIEDIDADREVMYLNVEMLLHNDQTAIAEDILEQHFPADDSVAEQCLYMHEVISLLLDYEGTEVDRMLLQWGERLGGQPSLSTDDKMLLADMYSCVGQHERAIALLQPVVESMPYDKNVWILMTDVRARAGQEEEAREAAGYAIAIDECDLRAIMAEYWLKAEQYRRLKDKSLLSPDDERQMQVLHDQCVEGMKWAKECGIDDTDDYNLSVGELFLFIDEPLQAIPYLRRELVTRPDNPDTQFLLASTLIDVQNFSEARDILRQILCGKPHPVVSRIFAPLAFCHFSLGEIDCCLTELLRASVVDPEGTQRYFSNVFPHARVEEYYDLVHHFFASKAST